MQQPLSGREAGPWTNELGEVLGPAVEQVRQQQPPPDAVQRALGRARHIGNGGPPRALAPRLVLLVAAAASLLLALSIGPDQSPLATSSTNTEGDGPALASTQPPITSPPRIFVGRTRVRGLPGAADDFMAISVPQMGSRWGEWERAAPKGERGVEAWIEDDSGRELHPYSLRVSASLEDKRSETAVEYLFDNTGGNAMQARVRMSLPSGAFPISRTVQVGDADPQDVDGEFLLPPGSTARARVVYYQRSRASCGALLYAYWLPRRLPERFSCTITADADLVRGHSFLPAEGELRERDGVVIYHLSRDKAKPSGLVILKSSPRP